MQFAGIDIGSRAIKLVVIDSDGQLLLKRITDTGFDPIQAVKNIMQELRPDQSIATGYGRNLFELAFDARTVTEIKAHGRGAQHLFPKAVAVLDIGGQDSKAISLFENGRVKKFEMNDRCAAGTGKFLEIMAKNLGFDIEIFGDEALKAEKDVTISSMCTVFAESEVTSLIAKGQDRREIALGLHNSVVRRAVSMINRVAPEGELVFTGGVARNSCIRSLLANKLNRIVRVPEEPQFVGALGAALLASAEV